MNDDGGKEGKIHHGGNPVLTAAALGAAVVPDVIGPATHSLPETLTERL
jgi:hypothetical protein